MPKAKHRVREGCSYDITLPFTAETKGLRLAGQRVRVLFTSYVDYVETSPGNGKWRKLPRPVVQILAGNKVSDTILTLEGAGFQSDEKGYYRLVDAPDATPATIARLLSIAQEPLDGEYGNCLLCDAPGFDVSHLEEHDPACPYRLAVEWARESDRLNTPHPGYAVTWRGTFAQARTPDEAAELARTHLGMTTRIRVALTVRHAKRDDMFTPELEPGETTVVLAPRPAT